ncbi:hypothetical protein NDU88_006838 [Pleurodeles waltl]|uniref:Secreted protein n=1 Tax=Pleurodeles waltl TaxID=8319 RepID=A0AAV7QMB3_PLEWA|nr:hypothetical protein NDU88_006838 [Pleurodeles waltl]
MVPPPPPLVLLVGTAPGFLPSLSGCALSLGSRAGFMAAARTMGARAGSTVCPSRAGFSQVATDRPHSAAPPTVSRARRLCVCQGGAAAHTHPQRKTGQ